MACPPLEHAELIVQQAPRVFRMVLRFMVILEFIDRNTSPLPMDLLSPCLRSSSTCSTAAWQLERSTNGAAYETISDKTTKPPFGLFQAAFDMK